MDLKEKKIFPSHSVGSIFIARCVRTQQQAAHNYTQGPRTIGKGHCYHPHLHMGPQTCATRTHFDHLEASPTTKKKKIKNVCTIPSVMFPVVPAL